MFSYSIHVYHCALWYASSQQVFHHPPSLPLSSTAPPTSAKTPAPTIAPATLAPTVTAAPPAPALAPDSRLCRECA